MNLVNNTEYYETTGGILRDNSPSGKYSKEIGSPFGTFDDSQTLCDEHFCLRGAFNRPPYVLALVIDRSVLVFESRSWFGPV